MSEPVAESGPVLEAVPEAVLEAEGLGRRYGELTVLDGVGLRLRAGEALGVVGPNGAGKTTLLGLLSGSLAPDAGTVRFRGHDVTALGPERRCRLGIARTHQVPRPFAGLTVLENVLVGAAQGGGLRGAAADRAALEALELCGLLGVANRRAGTLGLMHRKRLELARAVATGPSVLLLDEIGGGLTEAESAGLVETIRELRDRGAAVVWIEHVVHILVQVVDRLLCLASGRAIAEGAPDEVMRDPVVVGAYLGRVAE